MLYYCPGHMSFAPHVILNEIGLPFERRCLSIKSGDTAQAEFRAINPKGKVPVLKTAEGILTESSAILMYLALRYPGEHLLPDAAVGKAQVVEWLNWLSSMLPASIALRLHPYRFTDERSAWAGIQARGQAECEHFYQLVEQKLQQKTWAVSERFTVVDPMLMIFYRWGDLLGLDMSAFPCWQRHTENMRKRPAVLKTLATEEITI
jgi:glutathione S-transferase